MTLILQKYFLTANLNTFDLYSKNAQRVQP